MNYISRQLEAEIIRAASQFPSILLSGPRRVGKTTLLRHAFPNATYVLLEEPDVIDRVRNDPRGFLDTLSKPVILDEIQNIPELFGYIRARIDAEPEKKGVWFLTGSQDAPLMKGVSESMSGRSAIFQLLSFSTQESNEVTLYNGGFPEIIAQPDARQTWFRSYVQTYLERDVRLLSNISDLVTFRRFMALVVSRTGQILNKTELSAPLGVSVPTIGAWLNILEISGQILLVPPYFENFGKRLIKSPKVYFVDSGLASFLLGFENPEAMQKSTFFGPLFEGFIASEIVKRQISTNHKREIYFFRDATGLEVDFLIPVADTIALVECKASSTLHASDARSLGLLEKSIKNRPVKKYVVCRDEDVLSTVAPGVQGVGVRKLCEILTTQA